MLYAQLLNQLGNKLLLKQLVTGIHVFDVSAMFIHFGSEMD